MERPMSIAVATAALFFAVPSTAAPDWNRVDQVLGRSGVAQSGGVRRYSFPRSDLKVTLDGTPIKAALALGSWLSFQEHGTQTIVMGDLVLTHDEVNPVLSSLLEGGLTITALHNHLLRAEPATMYMHIHGHGDPVALATAIRSAISLSKTPTEQPRNINAQSLAMDANRIDELIGATGKANSGVYQFSIPRAESITENGVPVPAAMGLGTAINFQPTGDGNAAVTGDFVLVEAELTPVLNSLRRNGIEVTALHNHLTGEQPRLFFLHFWAHEDAENLAAGLRQALDQLNLRRD